MKTTQTARPFHETIVDAIQYWCNPSPAEGHIFVLLRLIRETKIPKGHDEIRAAVENYFDFAGAEKYVGVIREVKKHLEAQRKAAEEKMENKG